MFNTFGLIAVILAVFVIIVIFETRGVVGRMERKLEEAEGKLEAVQKTLDDIQRELSLPPQA